jgi:hypothetical protein
MSILFAGLVERRDPPGWKRGALSCVVTSFLLGVSIMAIFLDLPAMAAFYASRAEFERAAREVLANSSAFPAGPVVNHRTSRSIGLFLIEEIESFPGGIRFAVIDDDTIHAWGPVYCEADQPKRLMNLHVCRAIPGARHWWIGKWWNS